MRILIYGAGVIGSIFAGNLMLAGNDVTVLARGKRLEEIRRNGIVLAGPGSRKVRRIPVKTIGALEPDERYDYVIVAVQRTQIDELLPVLSENCSPNIVLVVNTAAGYEPWAAALGRERLMLGFPSAGGERRQGAVHYFIGRGFQRVFQTTTFGEYSGERTGRVRILISMFNRARIPSVYCKNMDAWQKTHVALVSPIANALYAFDCDNFRLGHSREYIRQMVLAIKEGRQVLRKNGVRPTPGKLIWLELSVPVLAFIFTRFMRTALAETTMAKHCMAAKSEMIFLQKEFDQLIRSSGIRTPAIDLLKKNLYSL